jgi:hypothetical protein
MTRDQAEVGSLSGGVMFQPLSTALHDGVRFLRTPLPAVPTASLAIRLPTLICGWTYGFTLFLPSDTGGVDLAYPPVAFASAYPERLAEHPATYLLVQA